MGHWNDPSMFTWREGATDAFKFMGRSHLGSKPLPQALLATPRQWTQHHLPDWWPQEKWMINQLSFQTLHPTPQQQNALTP